MSGGDIFATTRWTQVLAAQGASTHAGTALADLCAAYCAPVHTYIARTAHDLGDPCDLSQEFFARLLAGGVIAGADRERGRFRAYLLGAVKHFLADTRDRLGAAKRGAWLRKRFRDLVKAEIAQTVASEEEAREELRYLIKVVS